MLLIIINGLPGTGKTTLAKPLSQELHIPLIAKDTIKEFLFDELGVRNRGWSRTLGKASNEFLYILADSLLSEGQSIIIENAFEAAFAKPRIGTIIQKYHPKLIEIYCLTDPATRKQRFVERNELGQRHTGHADTENYAENVGSEPIEKYSPLELGQIIKIDTTNKVDFQQLLLSIGAVS